VTALYEVTLVGSSGERVPELRYGDRTSLRAQNNSELAYVKLRYKQPGSRTSTEVGQAVRTADLARSIEQSSPDLRFAASVAGFGQILQGGKYTGNWGYGDALQLARSARGQDPHGYRGEFLHLIELAQSLSSGS
jgi:Ca-activated chloride channel family protein